MRFSALISDLFFSKAKAFLLISILNLLTTGAFAQGGFLGLFRAKDTKAEAQYDPNQRFSVEELQHDYALLRRALEEGHPGIYWYNTKAAMNAAFDTTARQLDHPLTEEEFRLVLSPLIARIRCGHTGVFLSKTAERYFKRHHPRLLPFETSFYNGKLYIVENHSNDSTLRAGTELLSIEGEPVKHLTAQMRALIATDGFNQTYKNVRISSSFSSYYHLLYGSKDTVAVSVIDSAGSSRSLELAPLTPRAFSVRPTITGQPAPNTPESKPIKPPKAPRETESAGDRRRTLRFIQTDSTGIAPPVALLSISTFDDKGYKRFYRRAFHEIQQKGSKNVIINLRANGGGYSAAGRTLLRYLMDSSFRFSKSMIAPRRKLSFNKYLDMKPLRFFVRNFFSKKRPDGSIELRSGNDLSKPSAKYHFKGNVYVLTNGGTFSAAAIVAANLQAKRHATLVGRETGGGRAGCNAAFIPYLTLPETKVRIRFPLYRVLTDVSPPNMGLGVKPDVEINYRIQDVLANRDLDTEKAMELIENRPQSSETTQR